MDILIRGFVLAVSLTAFANFTQAEEAIDSAKIERIIGIPGKYNKEENVFKISSPRIDIKVKVDQWQMPAFMGLTSWAAFMSVKGQIMMMGDTVVFEDEVNPAMSAAFDAGLEVTGLHNHFFFDEPKVYFMHIGGMGQEDELARGVKRVYNKITEIRKAHPEPTRRFLNEISKTNSITPEPLEKILGHRGAAKDGMVKFVIGREATMHGAKVGKEMGVNTWAAFAGTDTHAVVDGDFAMLKDEVQPVLKAMRKGGINIVALHNHMTHDQPNYYFMHYWGKGKAGDLAKTVKQALETQSD